MTLAEKFTRESEVSDQHVAVRRLLSFVGFSFLTCKMDTVTTPVRVSSEMSGKALWKLLQYEMEWVVTSSLIICLWANGWVTSPGRAVVLGPGVMPAGWVGRRWPGSLSACCQCTDGQHSRNLMEHLHSPTAGRKMVGLWGTGQEH